VESLPRWAAEFGKLARGIWKNLPRKIISLIYHSINHASIFDDTLFAEGWCNPVRGRYLCKFPGLIFVRVLIPRLSGWNVFCVDNEKLKQTNKSRGCRAVNETPSHSYGVSLAVWDYTVLPANRHKWTHPVLTPARQAGTRFTYPGGMEGWVELADWLRTEMVYSPTDGHPSKY